MYLFAYLGVILCLFIVIGNAASFTEFTRHTRHDVSIKANSNGNVVSIALNTNIHSFFLTKSQDPSLLLFVDEIGRLSATYDHKNTVAYCIDAPWDTKLVRYKDYGELYNLAYHQPECRSIMVLLSAGSHVKLSPHEWLARKEMGKVTFKQWLASLKDDEDYAVITMRYHPKILQISPPLNGVPISQSIKNKNQSFEGKKSSQLSKTKLNSTRRLGKSYISRL